MRRGRSRNSLRRLKKPSPAMVVAMISLFFAMSGFGIAAKSMITGKQIKNGSIKAQDLANGAVTSSKLGPGSVTAGAIDGSLPRSAGARTTSGTQFYICSNGVIMPVGQACPAIPQKFDQRVARATNVSVDAALGPPFPSDCYGTSTFSGLVHFPSIRRTFNTGNVPSESILPAGEKISISKTGTYTMTIRGVWASGSGRYRLISATKEIGSGPNQGSRVELGYVLDPPVDGGETTQSTTINVDLDAGDTVDVIAGQCGPTAVNLSSLDVSLVMQTSQ